MKKILILVLFLVPCCVLMGLDVGFGVDALFSTESETWNDDTSTETDLSLYPHAILRLTPELELNPFVIIGIHKETTPTFEDWISQYSFGGGAGLYYHFIQAGSFSLAVGPKARAIYYLEPTGESAPGYSSYLELLFRVSLPVYLDIQLTKNLYLRSGLEILGFELYTFSRDTPTLSRNDTSIIFLDYYPWQEFRPYVGIYFML